MFNIKEDVLTEFAEAQRINEQNRKDVAHLDWSWSESSLDLHRSILKEAKRERRAAASKVYDRTSRKRRQYKTAHQADTEFLKIKERLKAGERPKKWGKRWKSAAEQLGIEVPSGKRRLV